MNSYESTPSNLSYFHSNIPSTKTTKTIDRYMFSNKCLLLLVNIYLIKNYSCLYLAQNWVAFNLEKEKRERKLIDFFLIFSYGTTLL